MAASAEGWTWPPAEPAPAVCDARPCLLGELPPLCMDRVVASLAAVDGVASAAAALPPLRRLCDVVRDVAVLCSVSRGVKDALVPLLASVVQPLSVYETVVEGQAHGLRDKPPTLAELKDACRANALRVYGSKQELIQRLEFFWKHDKRLPHCRLGHKLCARAEADYCYQLPRLEANDLRDLVALPRLKIEYYNTNSGMKYADIIKEALAKHGSAAGIEAERGRLEQEYQRQAEEAQRRRNERRDVLVAALQARGLVLRSDPVLCARYYCDIDGTGGRSLEEVVDAVEEISFFYRRTSYNMYLTRLRSSDCDYAYGAYDGVRLEERRRIQAKEDALRTWLEQRFPAHSAAAVSATAAAAANSTAALAQLLPSDFPRSLLWQARSMLQSFMQQQQQQQQQ